MLKLQQQRILVHGLLLCLMTAPPFLQSVHGWTNLGGSRTPSFMTTRTTATLGTGESNGAMEGSSNTNDADDFNPCWEDLYDDDCAMNSVYAASFIAADWIKSMPCASGLDDCDMPPAMTVPEGRPEAGVEQVDVMSFLGLRRVQPIDKPSNTASSSDQL